MLLKSEEISHILQGKWSNPKSLPQYFDSSKIFIDSRKISKDSLFIALKGEKFDGHDFIDNAINAGASAICISNTKKVSRNITVPVIVVSDTSEAYRKIALLNRKKSQAKIVAITGTCGKTSTKDFLHRIISFTFGENTVLGTAGNTNNLIGVPQNLLNLNENHKFAVIEMGTNHFGEIEELSLCTEPDIAIITSIGRGHLEFLKNVEGVAREKSCIFKGLRKNGIAIIPQECEFRNILLKEAQKYASKILSFSTNKNAKADITANCLENSIDGTKFKIFLKDFHPQKISLPIPGVHQISNAIAAILAAVELGIPIASAISALQSASISGMRMRKKSICGITFINDAYNSNPQSAIAALNCLSEIYRDKSNLIIFIGDMLELGSDSVKMHIEVVSHAVKLFPESQIITVGKFMNEALKTLKNQKIKNFKNSIEAAKFAKNIIKKDQIVFLKGSRGMAMEEIEKAFEE